MKESLQNECTDVVPFESQETKPNKPGLSVPETCVCAGAGLIVAGGSAYLLKQKKEGKLDIKKFQKGLSIGHIVFKCFDFLVNEIMRQNDKDNGKKDSA